MNKAQHTTRNIAKSGEVLDFNDFNPFQLCCKFRLPDLAGKSTDT